MVGSSLFQFWVVPPVVFILDRRARDLGPAGHRDGRREGGGGGGAGREGGVGGVGVWRGRSVARHLLTHWVTCSGDNISKMFQLRLSLEVTWVRSVLQLAVSVITRGRQGLTVLQTIGRGAGVAGRSNIYSRQILCGDVGPHLMVYAKC